MKRGDRVWTHERFGARGYLVVTLFSYQLAAGISLRWWERRPHLRLYIGPLKVAVGGLRSAFHCPEGPRGPAGADAEWACQGCRDVRR